MTKQPKAVWAVAFACVVAFMGIGLVDPILPALASDLDASPSQVELLFTSYFAFTGVSMLVTGFVSSRIGPRRTLLVGLALVVVFSALAGASGSVAEIVGFRAGWGLGNALFIATALAVIIGAASGGVVRRDHPLRGRARARHRLRPAARRPARRPLLARSVLRHRRPDGDRLRRDHGAAGADAGAARARSR